MNIKKTKTYTAVMSSGVNVVVSIDVDSYRSKSSELVADIFLEWANGEDVQDVSETSYTLEDLKLIAHLFNVASDYRNEL